MATSNNSPQKVRPSYKRISSFWDPLYEPNKNYYFSSFHWNFTNTTGIKNYVCSACDLIAAANGLSRFAIETFSFEYCDFRGTFDRPNLTFKNCKFAKCDFGNARWRYAKFSNCEFTECSFTVTAFSNCQFISCKWEKIGISGNETRFTNTILTNPWEFIRAAYTNISDPELLRQKNTNESFQLMRLEESKAKLAKILMKSLDAVGDDASFYDSVKTYLNQSIDEKISRAKHNFFSKKNTIVNLLRWGTFKFEKAILNISGRVNAWGGSIARPTLIGAALILVFSLIYYRFSIAPTFLKSLIMSFDITLLIGYTKQATTQLSLSHQSIIGVNALLGLWWYAVFVPTVINRISRVRT